MMRWSGLAVGALCAGVASCSLLSGASDLVIGRDGAVVPGPPDAEAGDGAATEAGMDGSAPDATPSPPGGALDVTFGMGGRVLVGFGVSEAGRALTVAVDGTIVVAGRTGSAIPTDFALARITGAGALDTTFGNGGKVTLDFASDYDEAYGVARTADGHLVAMGRCWSAAKGGFVVAGARFDDKGLLDPTFGTAGRIQAGAANANNQDGTFAMVLRPGDRPAVVGSQSGNVAMSVFLADGSADKTAGGQGTITGATGVARALAVQLDGKFVLAGFAPPYSDATATDVIVERRGADLALDATFGAGGRVTVDVALIDHAWAVAVAPDGKIVVVGDTKAGNDEDVLVLRFESNGAPDPTFGMGGRVVVPLNLGSQDRGRAVAIDASGRIVVAGSTTGPNDQDVLLLRLTDKGALDKDFGNQGVVAPQAPGVDEARDIRIMADGRIVIAGSASNGTDSDMLVQRFLP